MELVEIYRMGGQTPQYLRLSSRLLDDPGTPVDAILALDKETDM